MRKNKWVKITALASFVFLQSIYAMPVWAEAQGDGYEVTATDTAVGVNSDADNDHNWLGFDKEKTTNNTAIGANAKATAGNSTAIGANAQAQVKGSVALGEGSVANRAGANGAPGAVSVGSDTVKRQIINVAAGTQVTDAVNLGQLNTKADQKDLTKEVADRTSADTALSNRIDTKADQQDLTKEVTDRTNADKALSNRIDTKADQQDLTKEVTDRTNADKALSNRIDTKADQQDLTKEVTDRTNADKALSNRIDTKADQQDLTKEVTDRTNADTALGNRIDTKADQKDLTKEVADRTNADTALGNRIDTKADQKDLTKEVTDRTNADTALDNRITNETQRLDSRIDTLSDRVDKVGALAAAFSALAPMPYDPAGPTQISMGVGTYSGEQAMAIGVYHYVKNDVLLNAGFAISGSEKMGRAGVTWKIGGPKDKKVSVVSENSGAAINSNVGIGNEKQSAGVSVGVSDTEKTAY
jgi:hypothetical protein